MLFRCNEIDVDRRDFDDYKQRRRTAGRYQYFVYRRGNLRLVSSMQMWNHVWTATLSQRMYRLCRDYVGGATKWKHVGRYVVTLEILTSIDGLPTRKKSWASVVTPWITDATTPMCIS